MSVLFDPAKIGELEVNNRFVNSATGEGMATESGEVTDRLVERYRRLARGGVGLIITGVMYVHPLGRPGKYITGIHSDEMIPGLAKVADAVHSEGGKVVFQLLHAGRQTHKSLIGRKPMSASASHFDMAFMVRPREMTEDDIWEAIGAFGGAARRAAEAGADGVQLHAAHGYLINQFLSPFFNHRKDAWGGSVDNRFRFLRETMLEVQSSMPPGMPVLVKLNSNDYTPREGITPPLAAEYASRLAALGIGALEVSCGTGCYSNMNVWLGGVPVSDLVRGFPTWQKPLGWMYFKSLEGKFDLEEGYNLPAARVIKPVMGDVPLMTVGGFRNLNHMEDSIEKGYTDFISMCRPLIREPSLVRDFEQGRKDTASCKSCNKCVAVVLRNEPVRCVSGARSPSMKTKR